ncbi:MAG: flagellar protein [Lachnospiraceae bacterium]|nr:flagellar protein [Lachnospiraceae bacterium]
MDIQNNGFLSIEQLTDRYLSQSISKPANSKNAELSFREVLQQKTAEEMGNLKFSKHAAGRLADRNISLTQEQLERLNDGAKKAGQKGIKDSLVIVDKLAFIVNVPNNTVVTAMDSTETDDNIFTNINGAVIM